MWPTCKGRPHKVLVQAKQAFGIFMQNLGKNDGIVSHGQELGQGLAVVRIGVCGCIAHLIADAGVDGGRCVCSV